MCKINNVLLFIIARKCNIIGDPSDDPEADKGISNLFLKCPSKSYLILTHHLLSEYFDIFNKIILFDCNSVNKIIPFKFLNKIIAPVQFLNGLSVFIILINETK